jgi:hypothetical protein
MSSRLCLLVAIGVFVPALAMAQSGPMQGACASDVKTLCGSVEPGGGHIRECMKEHRAELSAGCKEALAERRQERHRGQSSDAPAATPKGDE